MDFYIDFPTSNMTSIDVNFEDYDSGSEIIRHMHHYYEFTLVTRGTCIHSFRGVDVPLIAGDVFLIPPNESHAYYMHSPASIVNCYFFPERVGQFAEYVSDVAFEEKNIPTSLNDVKKQWDRLMSTAPLRSASGARTSREITDNLTRQGVLHLPPTQAMDVIGLLHRIEAEHANLAFDSEYMKAGILQMILVIFKRARNSLPQNVPEQPDPKRRLILNSLIFLEEHYQDPVTVKEMAAASNLSESYFRGVFKEVMGLSPLDYLNRIRIARALEYLQDEELSITETAIRVGIPDSNYFTRLFKRITGESPRCFRCNPSISLAPPAD